KSVRRTARVKGYRPGKVPEKVIRQRYGDQVRREVVQDLVQSSYSEAVNREKLRPAGGPTIDTPIDAASGGDITYEAQIEVFPEFEPQGLEGLQVDRPEPALTDGDPDCVVDGLRRQRAECVAAERRSQDGDRIIID